MDGPVGREIRRGPTMPSSVVVRSLLTVETKSMDFLIELDQLQSSPSPREVQNLHGKRTLDALLILLALPFLIPLALLVTLLISSGSRGPVLFREERVGYQGRRFTCFKFRTMFVDADTTTHQKHLHQLMNSNTPMMKMDSRGDRRSIVSHRAGNRPQRRQTREGQTDRNWFGVHRRPSRLYGQR